MALHDAEPDLPISDIAERCGISRSSVVNGLAANADRQADQRREYAAAGVSRHAAIHDLLVEVSDHDQTPAEAAAELRSDGVDVPAFIARLTAAVDASAAERLTGPQIAGLETWLQNVDPDDPVIMPQLVIDAVQAIIEEVRDRRDGDTYERRTGDT